MMGKVVDLAAWRAAHPVRRVALRVAERGKT